MERIRRALDETKDYLHVPKYKDWTTEYYQYTNRLAHLYFLRVIHNIPAYLVMLYFIGDREMNGPQTQSEWLNAIQTMRQTLGLPDNHPLSPYELELLVHVDTIVS